VRARARDFAREFDTARAVGGIFLPLLRRLDSEYFPFRNKIPECGNIGIKRRAAGPKRTCLERTMTGFVVVVVADQARASVGANHFARILSNQFFMEMEKDR